jgi:hypothetical protein
LGPAELSCGTPKHRAGQQPADSRFHAFQLPLNQMCVDTLSSHRVSLKPQLVGNVTLSGIRTKCGRISGLAKNHLPAFGQWEWNDFRAHFQLLRESKEATDKSSS